MNMIPILARFDQQVFRDQFFLRFMVYLVERLDSTDGPTGMRSHVIQVPQLSVFQHTWR